MNSFSEYISGIFTAIKSLVGGLMVTWKELWVKKVTMQYPENRDTLVISDRWRAELIMPHDDNNEHACTSCGICMINCPNGTIEVISKTETTEDGKSKKVLDKHIWDNGTCTFCNLCVITCPSDAIIFTNDFEQAVFDRSKLVHQLNNPGSKLREKKKVAPAPKPAVEKAGESTPDKKVVQNQTADENSTTEKTVPTEVKSEEPKTKVEPKPKEDKSEEAKAESQPKVENSEETTPKVEIQPNEEQSEN